MVQAYLYDLKLRCQGEQHDKAKRMQTARKYFGRQERERRMAEAEALPTPACDRHAAITKEAKAGGGQG